MAKQNYRVTTWYKEIFQMVSKAVGGQNSFIWKTKGSSRAKTPIVIVSVDAAKNRVMACGLSKLSSGIDIGDIVYLKLDYRDSAFKTRIYDIQGAKITLEFPQELAHVEGRNHPRHYFHPGDEKYAQIATLENVKGVWEEEIHNVLVCDISEGGMAIFVPHKRIKYFEVKNRIKLKILGTHRVEPNPVGFLLFKIPLTIKRVLAKEEGYKLGIRFETKLSRAAMDRFLVKKNIFTIDEKEVVRGEVFRKKVQASMSTIKKNISKRKQLKEMFEILDGNRVEGHYLRQHISLLCEVMAGLGTQVGWVSDKSIEKLIYTAYLHDIRYIKKTHLARIASKSEFDKIKSTMSSEDQKAFLEGPAYAAEVARNDPESYPDSIKILLQQKELPDGSGFPHALKGSNLAPLSCLFIFSHYLVDYIIDHPDWNLPDFIKTYQHRLKGEYFHKLFNLIK